MDAAVADAEAIPSVAVGAKLHNGMWRALHPVVARVSAVFPFVEATRPRSKSGIQALCSLNVALSRAMALLRHCSECSKLYLAITGDSVLLKFEKARSSLRESLRRVDEIVTEEIGRQIADIVGELQELVFELDPDEKDAGDELIGLFHCSRRMSGDGSSDSSEIEAFHVAATKLGITSSRVALSERRALKKLVESARADDDKRKESVVLFLYNLMRKYSKVFRSDAGDDTDSQGSSPCSPMALAFDDLCYSYGGNDRPFTRQMSVHRRSFTSRLGSFGGGAGCGRRFVAAPPEELRCPISLQLMYDPVIVASGQTYERVCIEKWFHDGHDTCPKTQQQLTHRCLTPNYCVKALIATWCEQNGYPIPDGPPGSSDINWRASDVEATASMGCLDSGTAKSDGGGSFEEDADANAGATSGGCRSLLAMLREGGSMQSMCGVVERIRYLLKDDEEIRAQMGASGFVEAIVEFLRLAVARRDEEAQEVGAMALYNLAVNNNRNKRAVFADRVIAELEQMISNPRLQEPAAALYASLCTLTDAKPVIGSSSAVPFLVDILRSDAVAAIASNSSKQDALYALYNLSTCPSNIPALLSAGILDALQRLLVGAAESDPLLGLPSPSEKALAVIACLVSTQAGRREIVACPGLVAAIASLLDLPAEQEQAAACLLLMCSADEKCIPAVLQEGVVPALVAMSVSGTPRAADKAQKLLKLFRDHRQQQDPVVPPAIPELMLSGISASDPKPLCKVRSSNKLGRTMSSLWKNRSFAFYRC